MFPLDDMLSSLIGNLPKAEAKADPKPTGITRDNLRSIHIQASALAATLIGESDYLDDQSPSKAVYTELQNRLTKFFRSIQTGRAMTWEEVRTELRGVMTILAHALTPEGRAELLAGMKPKATNTDFTDKFKPSVN